MTYDQAVEYAKRTGPGLIMRDPKTGKHHFIIGSFEHWQKVYETIAVVEQKIEVRKLK